MAEAAVGKALAPTVARLRAGRAKNQALCRKRREKEMQGQGGRLAQLMENFKTQADYTLSPNLV